MADGEETLKIGWVKRQYNKYNEKKENSITLKVLDIMLTLILVMLSCYIGLIVKDSTRKDSVYSNWKYQEVMSKGLGGLDLVVGILIVIVKIQNNIQNNQIRDLKKLHGNIECNISEYTKIIDINMRNQLKDILGSSRIVFHVDIEPFDKVHINTIRAILGSMPEGVTSIYAIDNSNPNQWWTNSMLGYLACQAKWSSKKTENRVHRFFVLSKGEMSSPVGRKLIQLHHLIGFDTYIILDTHYDNILNLYNDTIDDKVLNREIFIWNNSTDNTSFLNREKIYGYHSYWNIMTPYNERNIKNAKDIYGYLVNLESEPIKFELLKENIYKNNSINIAKNYSSFITCLMKNTKTCRKKEDVVHVVSYRNDIIHIPIDIPIDIDTISGIIDKYIEICDNLA
ncbi:MAG: hypothetical protein HQK96_06775 [Nitrospirae bacterium]|nr:hypothetical protein [Nitrospirota bacterium]